MGSSMKAMLSQNSQKCIKQGPIAPPPSQKVWSCRKIYLWLGEWNYKRMYIPPHVSSCEVNVLQATGRENHLPSIVKNEASQETELMVWDLTGTMPYLSNTVV